MARVFLGIDPGFSGAIAVVRRAGSRIVLDGIFRLDGVPHAAAHFLASLKDQAVGCCLEQVHAFPKQGVSSTFKFGQSFGQCIGMLAAFGIPYKLVSPVKWQRRIGLNARGDKKVAAEMASALFGVEVKPRDADAVLIAHYCALTWNEREVSNGKR